MKKLFANLILLLILGCTGIDRDPLPLDKVNAGQIPNIPNARYWGDVSPDEMQMMTAEISQQRASSGNTNSVTILALSGGADNGAFGAGLLNAWTKRGDRPKFSIVTGVSTGALSAPFAFLGPGYDDDLKLVYGGLPASAIIEFRGLFSILPGSSVAESEPLEKLIADFVDVDMLAAIAREHKRGRRLFVQTTNLDAQRPVIWDMGAIASSGAPNALELFRKVLLASASLPGIFPPVLFEVNGGNGTYDEIHVDGGVISGTTVLSGWGDELNSFRRTIGPLRTMYVVRNGKVWPEAATVEPNILSLAGRSLDTLLKAQSNADLVVAYDSAVSSGAQYRVAWIGNDFDEEYPGPFDPTYMSKLFEYGYEKMASGEAWSSKPPQYLD